MISKITAKIVFSLLVDENIEFLEIKRVFCSIFLCGSVMTMFRASRSFGVILAIFVKSKTRASAPSRGRI